MPKHPSTDDKNKIEESAHRNDVLLARRRLLRLGAYVPPAIVGMAIIGSIPKAFASDSGANTGGSANTVPGTGYGAGGPGDSYGPGKGAGQGQGPGYHGHNIGSCMPSACRPCIDCDDDDNKNGKHPHDKDVDSCRIEKAKKKYRDDRKNH